MNQLFGGRFAPITDSFGFLRCSVSAAADNFMSWQQEIQRDRGVKLTKTKLTENFETDIRRLLPLTSVERRRYLFIPTRSDWTAFLDNGHQGTDVFAPVAFLARIIPCEAVRSTYVPKGRAKKYPATMFGLYGPNDTHFLNIIRSVGALDDGGRWDFYANGEVQPFEDLSKYTEKLKRERFTGEMLKAYLSRLGIDAFDEEFYHPVGDTTYLVEKTGPIAPNSSEFALASI